MSRRLAQHLFDGVWKELEMLQLVKKLQAHPKSSGLKNSNHFTPIPRGGSQTCLNFDGFLGVQVETWPGDGQWGVWQTTYVGVGGDSDVFYGRWPFQHMHNAHRCRCHMGLLSVS